MSSYPTFSPEEELEVIDGNIFALDLYNLRYFCQVGEDTLSDMGASSLAGSSVSR